MEDRAVDEAVALQEQAGLEASLTARCAAMSSPVSLCRPPKGSISGQTHITWVVGRLDRIAVSANKEARMSGSPTATLATHFANLTDPRDQDLTDHKLLDIVLLAICAVIGGAEG